MFKVSNRNTRRRCEICLLKLILKIPERLQWRRCGVFIVNFEHVSHFFSSVSIVELEQVNVSWDFIRLHKVSWENPPGPFFIMWIVYKWFMGLTKLLELMTSCKTFTKTVNGNIIFKFIVYWIFSLFCRTIVWKFR